MNLGSPRADSGMTIRSAATGLGPKLSSSSSSDGPYVNRSGVTTDCVSETVEEPPSEPSNCVSPGSSSIEAIEWEACRLATGPAPCDFCTTNHTKQHKVRKRNGESVKSVAQTGRTRFSCAWLCKNSDGDGEKTKDNSSRRGGEQTMGAIVIFVCVRRSPVAWDGR